MNNQDKNTYVKQQITTTLLELLKEKELSDINIGDSLIRAIGLILLGFGVVQVGLSLKSHDPSQRANGFLTLAGGVIITFAKERSEEHTSELQSLV